MDNNNPPEDSARVSDDTLAGRVRALMAREADTLQSAAARTGVGFGTIQGIVTGKRTNPERRTIQKIADGYGVDVDALLSDEDPVDSQARKKIGEAIREAREMLRMTQAQLAHAIGIKRSGTVSFWEAGKTAMDAPTLARIAAALQTSADTLLGLSIEEETPAAAYRAGAVRALQEGEQALREVRRRYEGEPTASAVDPAGIGGAIEAVRNGFLLPPGETDRQAG